MINNLVFTCQKPYPLNCPDPYQTKVQDHNRPKELFDQYHFAGDELNCTGFEDYLFHHLQA